MIDWECTKNDVKDVVSLFCSNLIHTSTSGVRCMLGDEDLRGWLATVVVVVASGTWWRVLDLLLVLGTLTSIVTFLATLVAYPINSAGCRVVRWSWVEWSWRTRRHIGWPRCVVCLNMLLGIQILRFWGPELDELSSRGCLRTSVGMFMSSALMALLTRTWNEAKS